MTFYAVEIDTKPAFGWEAGPSIDIQIATLRNKHELRNWEDGLVLHEFQLPFQNIEDPTYLKRIKAAYLAMNGRLHTFLTKDYEDYRHGLMNSADDPAMQFGEGDGSTATFQLSKSYPFEDSGAVYVRPIRKPLIATVTIFADGVEVPGAAVDPLTGAVEFEVAPADGAVLTWTGEFRICVRFNDFKLMSTIDNKFGRSRKFAVNGSCSLIEVPGE